MPFDNSTDAPKDIVGVAALVGRAAADHLAAFLSSSSNVADIQRIRLLDLAGAACPEQALVCDVMGQLERFQVARAEAEINELYQQLAVEHDDETFARLRELQRREAKRLGDALYRSMPVPPGDISKALSDIRSRLNARSSKDDKPGG